MTAPPLVSIALCTYNGARYLPLQLDSLLAQTYTHWEIVAVDDGSSDETLAILERHAQSDARFRIHRNATNLGFRRNFERALSLCAGELIAPCDQDDIWHVGKLEALVGALAHHQLAYCDSTLASEQGDPIGPRMSAVVPMISTDDPMPFAFGNCVSGHAMLFRRELLGRALPIPAEFFHDWWIAAVAAACGGIVFRPESLVLYRQHGANVTDERLGEMIEQAGLRARQARRDRPRGAKLKYFRETERRLAAIAALPGAHRAYATRLHTAWSRREHQWLSPTLAALFTRDRTRLLRLANFSDRQARRYVRDLFYGLRTKRLTDAYAYSEPPMTEAEVKA